MNNNFKCVLFLFNEYLINRKSIISFDNTFNVGVEAFLEVSFQGEGVLSSVVP